MQQLKTKSSLVLPLMLLSLAGHSFVTGEGPSLRSNLDLPYQSFGAREDEEDAPEIIVFYGRTYEADSIVFCVDASVSMSNDGRWELQKREVKRAITELSSNSEFGLVFYGADSYRFKDTLVPATETYKKQALAFVDSRDLTLGTCLGPGVVKSLELLRGARNERKAVIVAGDGKPTPCPFSVDAPPNQTLADRVVVESLAANPGLSIRVHTIFLGPSDDMESIVFMRRLAAVHRGTSRVVSG